MGEGDDWALTLMDGSLTPLQMVGSDVAMRGLSPNHGPMGVHILDSFHD